MKKILPPSSAGIGRILNTPKFIEIRIARNTRVSNPAFDVELKHVKEGEKKLKKNFPILIDQRGVAPEQYPEYE